MNIELTCAQCGKVFYRKKGQERKTKTFFCGLSCYRAWSTGRPSPTRKLPPDEQILAEYNAGSTFRQIADKYESKISSIGGAFRRLGIYADYKGRLPRGRDHHFYTDLPMDDVARQYLEGMTGQQLAQKYGTTVHCVMAKLKQAGIDARPAGFGHITKCSDGHTVRSNWERLVDEWLSEHGISHGIEPRLPWNRRRRADFLAGDCYVEVWGVLGNAKYEQKKRDKIADYEAHKCKLIELTPREIMTGDFSKLETLL